MSEEPLIAATSENPRPKPGSSRWKIDLKPLLGQDPSPEPPRHRSLEKTDVNLGKALPPFPAPGEAIPLPADGASAPHGAAPGHSPADGELRTTGAENLSGPDGRGPRLPPQAAALSDETLLKESLAKKIHECESLERTVDDLRKEIQVLRSDYTGQSGERLAELEALSEIIRREKGESLKTLDELSRLNQEQKQLKAQNLSLQYHLNSWGIPVFSGDDLKATEEGVLGPGRFFFPPLSPPPGGADPVPVILRGDLSSFYFPNLLHFLANTSLNGVVTVVTDGTVAKLYLEKGILLLAGWNNRERELSLAALFKESGLIEPEALTRMEDMYDLEIATLLLNDKLAPPNTIQSGLKEHARVILSFLFQLKRGTFFFQAGQIPRRKDLQFRLAVTDVLLKTAAEMDERTRDLGSELAKLAK